MHLPPTDQAEVAKTVVITEADTTEVEVEDAVVQEENVRPLSGRQASQMRSARARSAAQAEENVNPDRYISLFLPTNDTTSLPTFRL